MMRILTLLISLLLATTAASAPLRIKITEGVVDPLAFAAPSFIAENAAVAEYAKLMADVIAQDLTGTGLFSEIPVADHISNITSFHSPVQYSDWQKIGAQVLITGKITSDAKGQITVKFRIFDVFAGEALGKGEMTESAVWWRRMAHKVADEVYERITSEKGYFDSRVVFVSETGEKGARKKRLAIMDYDGENLQYLTDSASIVLAPRYSPNGERLLYTSYETGFPRIYLLELGGKPTLIEKKVGATSFSPRFAPNGKSVVYSREQGGNTDIYLMNLSSGKSRRLTHAASIETSPSFSPDGSQIVFESDRSGSQQLYVMSASGGSPKRISREGGRYATPVWSPRGDLIAFTKQNKGRFHIGVMRTDGTKERLLTASFLDEGPTWSPNGRVIMYTRETRGERGTASLYTVDILGRNIKRVKTPFGASDPTWSPLGP